MIRVLGWRRFPGDPRVTAEPTPRARLSYQDFDGRQLAGLAAIFAVVWLLWDTWWVYPLKMLVVLFHELSHGMAAIATGGSIAGIELLAREGGLCRTLGGNRFLTLSAGYLGSLLWGGLILIAAARSRVDQAVTTILGALLLLVALAWVRPIVSFGFLFALVAGALLLLAGLRAPERFNDYLLKVIGLTSMLYAVLDIKDDVLDRPHLLESDAAMLAQQTGLPTLFWGVAWIVIAVVAALFLLSVAGRKGARRELAGPHLPEPPPSPSGA